MNLSRRQVLKLGAGAAAAWMAGGQAVRYAWAAEKKIPVGLELWSVRHQCEQELPVVLEAIAEMGYTSVELAHSFYGHDVASWKKLLADNGLKTCGMHMGLSALEGDELEKTIATHEILETPYLIVASLPKKMLHSVEAIAQTGERFNAIAKRLAPHKMKVGYHCHGGDFAKVEGRTAWEWFGEKTCDDVILQLDIGNCLGGGGDPAAMLKAFPGRSTSIHIKDHGGKPGFVFGEGTVDWDEIFRICETIGGTKQYVVEEEGRKGPEALEGVRRALANYRKLRG